MSHSTSLCVQEEGGLPDTQEVHVSVWQGGLDGAGTVMKP
jgi:hypothetical protein